MIKFKKTITITKGKEKNNYLSIDNTINNNIEYIDIRYWYKEGEDNDLKPTKKGIHLCGDDLIEFKKILKELVEQL